MAGKLRMGPGEAARALVGTLGDWVRRTPDPEWHDSLKAQLHALPIALYRTLPWLLKAREDHDHSLVKVAMANAAADPGGLALEMHDERLSWAELDELCSRVAHVLQGCGVVRGDVVALLGQNSPMYIAITLGVARLGGTTALVNYHLEGAPLSHAVRASGARVAIAEKQFAELLGSRQDVRAQLRHLIPYRKGELEERIAEAPREPFPRVVLPASSDYIYIYTSGTTGLPKPCRVTHARALVAGASFGQLIFEFKPGDKLYCVLPLYHSSAMLIGAGGSIMTRTPMALREHFSATSFWTDVERYRATAILYIGELCRYLLNSPPTEAEKNNPVRVALGNGLRADVWEPFQRRFEIPMIREFYSATEAPGAIFNLSGKVGSIGHVPLRRLGPLKLARYDVDQDELLRDRRGLCVECTAGEVGELLIRLADKPRSALGDFAGYTDAEATERKILRDVFKSGDRYFRSGDLMRFDDNDYFYFVDRIGDTYRWKGENVSTAEVAEVLGKARGVREATVSGVHVPGAEGQAGLAAVVCDNGFDPEAFWRTAQELPGYAQPRFVRVIAQLQTTGTFKIQKRQLRAEGVDPNSVDDPMYVRGDDGYLPLTRELWQKVIDGELRL
jgi:fatty-acyl-CoA synthase